MNGPMAAPSAAARYDRALHYARDRRLPEDAPRPLPTAAWPPENVALLERYQEWLLGGGSSQPVVDIVYLPIAGHVLGLSLKPHHELDLAADLDQALDYVKAKGLSASWTKMCRNALGKFRTFLRQERGQIELRVRTADYARHCAGLPDWLIAEMERYQHLMQRNWRPARLNERITNFRSHHVRLWRWLFEHYPFAELADIKRQHLLAYVDHRLAAGRAASGVNSDLRYFRAFLLFLQDQEYRVPQALLRLPSLKQPDSLPRFLTDEQVRLLRDDLDTRFEQARSHAVRRNAALDRAAFYLMWQAGLRVGEAEELCMEDLDLGGRKLMVRRGKGNKDRPVYLTDKTLRALQAYLALRGVGATSHIFLYRNRPLNKGLLHSRIRAAGERVGVDIHPHRLRHTCATQLLNAGCRVTSIQKLLGHRRLNSTIIYARVHDQAVAEDYYAAMARIEGRLDPRPVSSRALTGDQRASLLELVARLEEPELSAELRLDIVAQMRPMLDHVLVTQGTIQSPVLSEPTPTMQPGGAGEG